MKPTPRSLRKSSKHQFKAATAILLCDGSDDSSFTAISKNKVIQKRRTSKERKLRTEQVFNGGSWSRKERLGFLRGLRKFGPGKWKKIQTILQTRSNIQIKSHGQKILQRLEAGEDIYRELQGESTGDVPSSATSTAKKEEDDSYSTASTAPSTASSSATEGEDETASMVSEISWIEPVGQEQKEEKNDYEWRSYKSFDTMAYPTTATTKKIADDDQFVVSNNQIIVQSESKPASSLSLDEATVVLALYELSNPVKLHDRAAAATRATMV